MVMLSMILMDIKGRKQQGRMELYLIKRSMRRLPTTRVIRNYAKLLKLFEKEKRDNRIPLP